jgi:hypothetical protein
MLPWTAVIHTCTRVFVPVSPTLPSPHRFPVSQRKYETVGPLLPRLSSAVWLGSCIRLLCDLGTHGVALWLASVAGAAAVYGSCCGGGCWLATVHCHAGSVGSCCT